MSRRVSAFQRPCHEGEEWTCAGCLRVQCRRCDGIPGDEVLCWDCLDAEDPNGDAA